jgi:hypothetical protein
MTIHELPQLQALAIAERRQGRPWHDVAKVLLDQGVPPADMAAAILPLLTDTNGQALVGEPLQGHALAVLWAAVLLPEPDADIAAVRTVFEAHGIDLHDAVNHLMDHSGNQAANRREAAKRLGLV